MDDSTTGKKTVYLHVGAPSAGAAYLQRVLWTNRRRLADQGVGYPVEGPLEHFAGVMDLRDMTWGGRRDPAWKGAWDRISGRARRWKGDTVVISQELLGGATAEQVAHAVESLQPADVHVVFITRDLGWQLVLDWQEQVKHAHTITFERFIDDLVTLGIGAPAPYGEMFWGLHDPGRVLKTWESAVPADRIHVLTLPPPGEAPGLLWRRYCGLIGIDPASCDLIGMDEARPLGVLEMALLRRLNEKVAPALGGDYETIIRDHIIGPTLREWSGSIPMRLPDRHYTWLDDRSRELVEGLRKAGYGVVGDLGELEPLRDSSHAPLPGEVSDAELLDMSTAVVTGLLLRLSAAHDQIGLAHLHDELAQVRENMSRLLQAAATPSPGLRRATRRLPS
ncbi:hypothetical protein [Thermomonospora umbrina]|uniref:Sulfotransferase family protein n=1 Tax=Thermomonospora umbrina TaxID=111806 RepID=A0A3D9SKT8_9ACTN|nr:hypothetical protein [Thermomonospora umbrina]REE96546.1 hypothetical protein DFJ69_1983 [Thermomonospora umbrina]